MSKLSPSSVAKRVACLGSFRMENKYRSLAPENEYAAEGEAAHWVAAQYLRSEPHPKVGQIAPNKVVVTQEMLDCAEVYLKDVFLESMKHPVMPILHIEKPLSISYINAECKGIPDCWTVVKDTLFLWDYKYGHRYVEVYNNWQLIEYAAGIINGDFDTIKKVVFTIVQPRNYNSEGQVRKWAIASNLLVTKFEYLKLVEKQALMEEPPLRVSPMCNFCSAKYACPELQQQSLFIAQDQFDGMKPQKLTTTQLGKELKALQDAEEILKARIMGLEEHVLFSLKKGNHVPYYFLEQSTGRENWVKSVEDVLLLGELLGVNLAKPQEVITPKQAVKKGVPQELMQEYSIISKGALKVVKTDLNKTQRIFNQFED